MLELAIGIDASRATSGAREATTALDSVYGSAARVIPAVQGMQRSLSAAFQATGGTTQIAAGITQTAQAFGQASIAAGAFGASRVLLEIGKTTQDFREFGRAVGASGGFMSTLGAIMRAHPLLTIAGVIASAASVMSLFGSNTRKTAADFDALAESVQKARLEGLATTAIGGDGASIERGARADAIRKSLASVYGGATPTLSELGGVIGGGNVDVLRLLAAQGNQNALEYLRTGRFPTRTGGGGQMGSIEVLTNDLSKFSFTNEQARGALTAAGRSLQDAQRIGAISAAQPATADGVMLRDRQGYPVSQSRPSIFGQTNYVEQDTEGQVRVASDVQRAKESAEQLADEMERARESAAAIGESFGAAMASVLFGTQSLRQALAGLVRQGAGSALQAGFGAAFGALGKTIAQGRDDTGSSPP